MDLSRRRFLQGAAAGAAAATLPAADAGAFGPREPKQLPKNAVGMLYDSTLCIGCRAAGERSKIESRRCASPAQGAPVVATHASASSGPRCASTSRIRTNT